MSFEIVWSDRAIEQTHTFTKSVAKRIIKKIEGIKDYPEHFLETLENTKFFQTKSRQVQSYYRLKKEGKHNKNYLHRETKQNIQTLPLLK